MKVKKCKELLGVFLKIGAFTFGGGYAMIPLIKREVAEGKKWLTEEEIFDIIAIAESTPGPLAVNCATFVGSRVAGFAGALAATLGVVLPSFLIILLISGCYKKFQNSRLVKGAMQGLKPAVVALIAAALLSVGENVFRFEDILGKENIVSAVILLIGGFLCYKKVHPIAIIGVSAAAGVLSAAIGV